MYTESDCATCSHHQPSLDPGGCFVQAGPTGFWGRLSVLINGCCRYRQMTAVPRVPAVPVIPLPAEPAPSPARAPVPGSVRVRYIQKDYGTFPEPTLRELNIYPGSE
jgi:hypothetical protein